VTRHLTIDFVSDVACPWCAVGFLALEEALRRTAGVVTADVHCQPFELNPDLGPEGENVDEHLARKGVGTPAQLAAGRAMLRERAATHGFAFNQGGSSRMWNTFDAHRLLHWAGTAGRQRDLKRALFRANFSDDANVSDPEVLVALATGAGLDAAEAREVLASGRYAAEVREAERLWIGRGIRGVPGIVIEGKWLISGGQPADVFEDALRRIAAEPGADAAGGDRSHT
jgi:predicted DsbA family dithiol-disulfide isomerase